MGLRLTYLNDLFLSNKVAYTEHTVIEQAGVYF